LLAKNFDEFSRSSKLNEVSVDTTLENFNSLDDIVSTSLKGQEEHIVKKLRERKRNSFLKGIAKSDLAYGKRHSALPVSFDLKRLLSDKNITSFERMELSPISCLTFPDRETGVNQM
jgi:hypothetical protein